MVRSFFFTIAVLASQSAWPADIRDLKTCEQWLNETGEVLARIEIPPLKTDRINPLMQLLEPLVEPDANDIGHTNELVTARDYATYLHQRGYQFVFVSTYRGARVPVFDGFAIDSDGDLAYNVSLKYSSVRRQKMDAKALIDNLRSRINLKGDRQKVRTLFDWFCTVNHLRSNKDGNIRSHDFDLHISRATELAYFFGLSNPYKMPCGRELRTVLDMRESGYSFGFVHGLKDEIQKMVDHSGHGVSTLTLLWDKDYILEF